MAKKEITFTIKPGSLNFPTLGFHLYGQDYLDYAVAAKKPRRYSPVPYFLYCQSIELLLKSYLSAYGFKREKLRGREFGHDLEKLLSAAREHHLDNALLRSTKQRELAIRKANNLYRGEADARKQFNYLSFETLKTSMSELPDFRILEGIARRLALITHSIVGWKLQ